MYDKRQFRQLKKRLKKRLRYAKQEYKLGIKRAKDICKGNVVE